MLGWQPLEREQLGGWVLRASAGFTGRGNSVLPLGDPGIPLDAAVAQVEQWYAARHLSARFQIPLPGAEEVDRELERRGWPAYNPTVFMTAPLAEVLRRDPAPGPDVMLLETPTAAWLAAYHYRGEALPPVATRLLRSAPWQRFALVGDGVAIGRVAAAAGWAGITAMEVDPQHRRRGLGGRVLHALCAAAATVGADSAYLQMPVDNTAAGRLYAGWGFREHHRYHYRKAPGPEPGPR